MAAMADEQTEAARRAQIWHEEALRLAAADQRPAAVLLLTEALARYRTLLESDPLEHLPRLAQCASALASLSRGLSPREEVLALLLEATSAYRTLCESHPDTFTRDLALSLRELSVWQSACGLPEEALTSARRSAYLLRELRERSGAERLDLAAALMQLSHCESALGMHEEALTSARQSVERYGSLSERSSLLVLALETLALRQSDMGLREEALSTSLRAIVIRRELCASAPDEQTVLLARALNNLSNRQHESGLRREALASAEESAALLRERAARVPVYRSDLAIVLQTLSSRRGAIGDLDGALASLEEAIAVWRALCDPARPSSYLALSSALYALAQRNTERGRLEAAVFAAEEAYSLSCGHAPGDPLRALRCAELLAAVESRRHAWGAVVGCVERALPLVSRSLALRPREAVPVAMRAITLALEAALRQEVPAPAALIEAAGQIQQLSQLSRRT